MKLTSIILNAEVKSKTQAAVMTAADGVLFPLTFKEIFALNSENQRTGFPAGLFSNS
jgi:hypothetical protein